MAVISETSHAVRINGHTEVLKPSRAAIFFMRPGPLVILIVLSPLWSLLDADATDNVPLQKSEDAKRRKLNLELDRFLPSVELTGNDCERGKS